MAEDAEDTTAQIVYRVDCPCGYINHVEFDPAGTILECDDCDRSLRVVNTL